MTNFNVLDLFSGCGGLSIGLRESGLNIEVGIDNSEDALKTYHNAHPDAKIVCSNVTTLMNSGELYKQYLRDVNIIVGGPPCQGFCAINPKRSKDDPRNSCVDYFAEIVGKVQPTFVLIENVTGLLSLDKGYALKSLVKFLKSNGYFVNFKVLQAAHYGVPQIRWRLFIAASKVGLFNFPEPKYYGEFRANFPGGNKYTNFSPKSNDLFTTYKPAATVKDAISDLPPIANGGGKEIFDYSTSEKSDLQVKLRMNSHQITNHMATNLGNVQLKRVLALPEQGMNWWDLPEDLVPNNLKKLREKYGNGLGCRSRFGRLSWNGQFTTILTKPELYWGTFIHPEQNRVISVREAARAQTFPDRIKFHGNIASQYRQIGNAVPPLLAEAIGTEIKKHLNTA